MICYGAGSVPRPGLGNEDGIVLTSAHLKLSDEIRKNNISTGYYESGHMVYIDSTAAAKYHADLVKFVQGALPK